MEYKAGLFEMLLIVVALAAIQINGFILRSRVEKLEAEHKIVEVKAECSHK